MTEDYVQVQPDSTGAKVRTLDITTLVNGEPVTVEMQVVGIADGEGRFLALVDEQFRHELLEELRAIRHGLEHIVGAALRE